MEHNSQGICSAAVNQAVEWAKEMRTSDSTNSFEEKYPGVWIRKKKKKDMLRSGSSSSMDSWTSEFSDEVIQESSFQLQDLPAVPKVEANSTNILLPMVTPPILLPLCIPPAVLSSSGSNTSTLAPTCQSCGIQKPSQQHHHHHHVYFQNHPEPQPHAGSSSTQHLESTTPNFNDLFLSLMIKSNNNETANSLLSLKSSLATNPLMAPIPPPSVFTNQHQLQQQQLHCHQQQQQQQVQHQNHQFNHHQSLQHHQHHFHQQHAFQNQQQPLQLFPTASTYSPNNANQQHSFTNPVEPRQPLIDFQSLQSLPGIDIQLLKQLQHLQQMQPLGTTGSTQQIPATGEAIDNKAAVDPRKYKTRTCRNWELTGFCPYEHTCCFAHGPNELRDLSTNHKLLASIGYFSNVILLAMTNGQKPALPPHCLYQQPSMFQVPETVDQLKAANDPLPPGVTFPFQQPLAAAFKGFKKVKTVDGEGDPKKRQRRRRRKKAGDKSTAAASGENDNDDDEEKEAEEKEAL